MMTQRQRFLAFSIAFLVAIWVVAIVAVKITRNFSVTADEVLAYVEDVDLNEMDDQERADYLARLADMVNRLEWEERQSMRQNRPVEPLFESMTEQEREAFVEATLPEGMKQMMEALNRMEPEERRKLVDKAIKDIQESEPEDFDKETYDGRADKIVEVGLKVYYEDANADTKLELAPLVEHLQRRVQGLRRR